MESGSGDAFSEFTDYSLFYVLPNEIVISIFRKLPIHELSCTIPSVCKQWFFISTDNLLWRELYGQKMANNSTQLEEAAEPLASC